MKKSTVENKPFVMFDWGFRFKYRDICIENLIDEIPDNF